MHAMTAGDKVLVDKWHRSTPDPRDRHVHTEHSHANHNHTAKWLFGQGAHKR
jgi:hypothetical protein